MGATLLSNFRLPDGAHSALAIRDGRIAALGAAALFALSLGMGVPMLIVGASAGRPLSKVGP